MLDVDEWKNSSKHTASTSVEHVVEVTAKRLEVTAKRLRSRQSVTPISTLKMV